MVQFLPFITQNAHKEHIPAFVVFYDSAAHTTLNLKTAFFIRADGAWIVFKDGKGDTAQVEFDEAKLQNQFHGFGAVALAPIFTFVDSNTHKRITRTPVVDHINIDIAQQAVIIQGADTEEMIRG